MENELKWSLITTEERVLLRPNNPKVGDVYVDFLSNELRHREKFGMKKNDNFSKVLGYKKGCRTVVDATAGLGTDSFVMALMGFQVRGVEKSELIFKLLKDAQRRAQSSASWRRLKGSLDFECHDSIEYLKSLSEKDRPDVVYIDPMFPHKKKSALSSKEMQCFQEIIGVTGAADRELVEVALKVSKNRVVVKRPVKAPLLIEGAVAQFKGASVRYDLYSMKGK